MLHSQNLTKQPDVKPPLLNSISVDGSCLVETGIIEFRAVHTHTREELFCYGPYCNGTNNIAEYLAIVFTLEYLKENGWQMPVYSDSSVAIYWTHNNRHNSYLKPDSENAYLFELLQWADFWLKRNSYRNPVLKWLTRSLGENPADFGRKLIF